MKIVTEEVRLIFFIELPLKRQLQSMFSRPGFRQKLRYRFERVKKNPLNYEDIYDGLLYREHFANNDGFLSQPNNISFMWYTDGMAIYHSTNFSIWPIYLVVNKLPYKERVKKDNIILAGLYFGTSKPVCNLF